MKYIIIPLFVGVITQCIKFIIETIKTKKINILRLFDGMGGMPSTHSSLVSSLSTIIYLNYGINNPLTSIVIIFSHNQLYFFVILTLFTINLHHHQASYGNCLSLFC